jgi:hypothetical protein
MCWQHWFSNASVQTVFKTSSVCMLCSLSNGLQWWLIETLQHFPRILASLGSGDDRKLTLLFHECTFTLIVIYLPWRLERKLLNSAIYRVNLEPNLIRTTYRLRTHISILLSVTTKMAMCVGYSGAKEIIGVLNDGMDKELYIKWEWNVFACYGFLRHCVNYAGCWTLGRSRSHINVCVYVR